MDIDTTATAPIVTPMRIFDTLQAYRQSAALQTAIDLDLFSRIVNGSDSTDRLASELNLPVRGISNLCDFLVTDGFLKKSSQRYELTVETSAFLDRKSPAYIGHSKQFLCSRALTDGFNALTEYVRRGGAVEDKSVLMDHNPVWVDFARGMTGLQITPAQNLASLIELPSDRPLKVLDIAASHGLFGIAVANKYPQAVLYALDWPAVLEVTRENALQNNLNGRFQTVQGDVFTVDLGSAYDLVLLVNFLHHFSLPRVTQLLQRVANSLAPDGMVAIAGFFLDDDRITPAPAARFSLSVFASTEEGQAHTFNEVGQILEGCGFSGVHRDAISAGAQMLITARKK